MKFTFVIHDNLSRLSTDKPQNQFCIILGLLKAFFYSVLALDLFLEQGLG